MPSNSSKSLKCNATSRQPHTILVLVALEETVNNNEEINESPEKAWDGSKRTKNIFSYKSSLRSHGLGHAERKPLQSFLPQSLFPHMVTLSIVICMIITSEVMAAHTNVKSNTQITMKQSSLISLGRQRHANSNVMDFETFDVRTKNSTKEDIMNVIITDNYHSYNTKSNYYLRQQNKMHTSHRPTVAEDASNISFENSRTPQLSIKGQKQTLPQKDRNESNITDYTKIQRTSMGEKSPESYSKYKEESFQINKVQSTNRRGRRHLEPRRQLHQPFFDEALVFTPLDFVPLSCNSQIIDQNKVEQGVPSEYGEGTSCNTTWTSKFGSNVTTFSERVVISCGECIVMDNIYDDKNTSIPRILTFLDGIDIVGKLVIPDYPDRKLGIATAMILVQGELVMAATTKPINGIPNIQVTMIAAKNGTAQDMWYRPQNENSQNCGRVVNDTSSIEVGINSPPCVAGSKGIVVAGGKMSIRGIPPNTPTWVKLYDVVPIPPIASSDNEGSVVFVDGLVVPDSVIGTWDIGAEILITSHTLEWDNHKVRRIVDIKSLETGGTIRGSTSYVILYIDEPIIRPTTVLDSESPKYNFAVEVALLSRNILWDADATSTFMKRPQKVHVVPGTTPPPPPPTTSRSKYMDRGGHFMIYHTPNILQYIEGVDIQRFGQQGSAARYPIHFHFSGSVKTGSIVSKNTIRHSFQRCVVLHATDRLIVQQNIAYDTVGHCYMSEDGVETGTHFVENLGALTRIQPHRVLDDDTDDRASTFWITNPLNSYYGNVAAGSEYTGFFIEPTKRGLRKRFYTNLDPFTDRLILFQNNIAHSNFNYGVRTYPMGYSPKILGDAILDGMVVYRNRGGVFVSHSERIIIQNSIFADNNEVSIDIDKESDSAIVRDCVVIGYSDSYRNVLQQEYYHNTLYKNVNETLTTIPTTVTTSTQTNNSDESEMLSLYMRQNVCYGVDDSICGIDLHTYQRVRTADHIFVQNVSLIGFNQSQTPCDVALPFHLSDIGNYDLKPFDTLPTFIGINAPDADTLVDLCKRSITDVYLNVLNSSTLLPSDSEVQEAYGKKNTMETQTQVILSQQDTMTKFVNIDDCIINDKFCYVTCPDNCFTTSIFRMDPFDTEGFKVKICQNGTSNLSKCIIPTGSLQTYHNKSSTTVPVYREFLAHLPSGNYTAEIYFETVALNATNTTLTTRNKTDWPNFVIIHSEPSVCPLSAYTRADIVLSIPKIEDDKCQDLIINGNMEDFNNQYNGISNIPALPLLPKYWGIQQQERYYKYNNFYLNEVNPIQLKPGYGIDNSTAVEIGIAVPPIQTPNNVEGNNTSNSTDIFSASIPPLVLMQYIDTRCIQLHLGGFFTLSARIQLAARNSSSNGEIPLAYTCETPTSKETSFSSAIPTTQCPDIGIGTDSGYVQQVAYVPNIVSTIPYQVQSEDAVVATTYQIVVSGTVFLDPDVLSTNELVYAYIRLVPDNSPYNWTMYVDDVSMQLNEDLLPVLAHTVANTTKGFGESQGY